MKKIIKYLLLTVTVVFSAILLMTYIAPFIPPKVLIFPQILGLFYPYILLINIVLCIVWICLKKWFFLIPVLTILTNLGSSINFFGFSMFGRESVSDFKTLRVVSFNVRVFDLYNWRHNTESKQKIIDYLKEIDADIICFQEYFEDLTNEFETARQILRFDGINHYKKLINHVVKNTNEFGIATFSKYPIIDSGDMKFSNTFNSCLWTDILVGNDTVRVYNMHLQSNYFNADDYQLLDNVNNNPNAIELRKMLNMYGRLSAGYLKRAEQAKAINEYISQSPHSKIVCADLNDSPFSYSYRKIKNNFTDAFSKAGF